MQTKFSWIYVLILLLLTPDFSLTTTGGPQEIRLLGYMEDERKVYWLTYFRDEAGRLPQLSYIDFSTGVPFTPVVDTLWMGEIQPYHMEMFVKRLAALKSQLVPLHEDMADSIAVTARILKISSYTVPNESYQVRQFDMAIMLRSGILKGTEKITAYVDKRVGASQWRRIPNERYGIAVFSYTGIPWEGGYSKDIVVALKPEYED